MGRQNLGTKKKSLYTILQKNEGEKLVNFTTVGVRILCFCKITETIEIWPRSITWPKIWLLYSMGNLNDIKEFFSFW